MLFRSRTASSIVILSILGIVPPCCAISYTLVDHGPVVSHFAEFVEFLAGPDHDPVSAINVVKDHISLFVSMAAQAQQQAAKRVASRRDTPGVKKGSHIKKVFDHRGRQWSNYDLSIPPKTGPEAYDRADFESRWKKSMLREMDNLTEHKTYGPWRPKKPGEHIIGFTWGEFKTKESMPLPELPLHQLSKQVKSIKQDCAP